MTDAILHGMGLLTKDSISSIKIGGVLQLDLFGEDNLLCGRVVYARQGYGLMRIQFVLENTGAHYEYETELKRVLNSKNV